MRQCGTECNASSAVGCKQREISHVTVGVLNAARQWVYVTLNAVRPWVYSMLRDITLNFSVNNMTSIDITEMLPDTKKLKQIKTKKLSSC